MTPVNYTGDDYYKKMLELQRRLRQSEAERIRLEERFSLLEHESRSRGIPLIDNSRIATTVEDVRAVQSRQSHETCINRLRMRYIEFLEEQQARDERNHKLLGALDRVDSSLALISAKTDRLGTMRRQYEAASLFKNWYVNRRQNGSVAGDSGVASQNNDGHGTGSRHQDRVTINKHNKLFNSPVHPNITTAVRNLGSANYSPSNEPTDSRYDFRRPTSIRQENTQMLPHTSLLSPSLQKSETNIPTNANLKYFVENRPENASQSLQQSSRKNRYDYPPFNYNLLESSRSPLRSQTDSLLGYSRDPATRRASLLQRNLSKKSFPVYSGFFKDDIISSSPSRSPSQFPKAIDITNQDYGNDDDVYRVGDIVENELERYMSRIPKLYRDRPQSPEEFDQEQNTSGDLLNVTFSDDGLDFSAESRTRDGRTSPAELGHFLSHQKPESEKIGRSKLPNVYQNTFDAESGHLREAGLKATGEGREIVTTRHEEIQHGNRDFPIASDVPHRQLPSITSLSNPTDIRDKSRSANNEKIAALAKNEISLDVPRDATESGTRPSINNEDTARARENRNREINANTTETRQMGRDARLGGNTESKNGKDDAVNLDNSFVEPKNLDVNKHRIFSGEELEAGMFFQEYTEDLEPWNPSALEKRVQGSMILKNESQFDSIQRESEHIANDEQWAGQETEINVSGTDDAAEQLHMKGIENYAAGVDAISAENVETSLQNQTDSNREQTRVISEVQNQNEVSNQRFEGYNESDAFPIVTDRLIDQSSHDRNNTVDPNVQYEFLTGVEDAYANQETATYSEENYAQDQMQYEYPVNEQYQEGSNVEPQQQQEYDPQDNAQYKEGTNENEQYQYQVDDQRQYQGYSVDEQNSGQRYTAPESHEQYSADSNAQYITDTNAQYVTEPNQEYVTDPNQEYVTEPNQEYVTDPNQEYVTEPNQEYVTDPNQEYVTDPNQEYVTDPNQEYVTDPNQEYVTDPNQEYVTDPNQEYVTDPNQEYITDPNQQYVTDPNEHYVTNSNQQYVTDPNEPYATDPNEQYAADPSQEYSGDAQQYPESGAYVQVENQEYVGNEAYKGNGLTGNEGHVTESDHGQGLETSVEADDNQGYGQGYEPPLETDHSQVFDQGPNKSAADESQTDIRDDQSENKLLGVDDLDKSNSIGDTNVFKKEEVAVKKTKDVIKSLLDSDTESTIERNVSNAESDFDFN